jgi:DNA-binding NarL/FixJ family response regulator
MTIQNRDLFLLVSDDALLVRTLTQVNEGRAELVDGAHCVESISREDRARVRGVFVDGALMKQNVVRELTRLRTTFPLAHMMFIATAAQTYLLNDIQPLRVDLFARPLPQSALAPFIERALSAGRLSSRSMRAWIEEMAGECRLTSRDVALMPLVLETETADATCARLGLDEATLQRSLRRLVKKCRVRNTDRLAKNMMRDALLFSRELTIELIEPMAARAASF